MSALFPSDESSVDESIPESSRGLKRSLKKRAGVLARSVEKKIFVSSSSSSKTQSASASPVPESLVPSQELGWSLPAKKPFPSSKFDLDVSRLTPQSLSKTLDEVTTPMGGDLFDFRRVLLAPLSETMPISNSSHVVSSDESDPVDHVLFVVHGIGASNPSSKERKVEEFRETLEFVKRHWFWPVHCEMHVELINWKSLVADEQERLFRRVLPKCEDSDLLEARGLLNQAVGDVGFYTVPFRKAAILKAVGNALNDAWGKLKGQSPRKFRNAKVNLVGYSLGSVILHDLLADGGDKVVLEFPVNAFFLLGSPLGAQISMQTSPPILELPARLPKFFNIYHPRDPVAFRVEPLFFREEGEESAPAVSLDRWDRPGAVEEKITKRWSFFASQEPTAAPSLLPHTHRLDFVLSPDEGTTSAIPGRLGLNLSMLAAHSCYWTSRDLALFILKTLTSYQPNAFAKNPKS